MLAAKYIQRTIRLRQSRKHKAPLFTRLTNFFDVQIAAFRFKKARVTNTVQEEITLEMASKGLNERKYDLEGLAG